jgi:hypothetical protein
MIDIVYIVAKGSHWQDNELRYSLRSLEKFGLDVGKVFIIGEKPSFINEEAIHIPYRDVYANKARNIMCKIHWACRDTRVSQNFVLMNDDYFLLNPIKLSESKFYYKCDLERSIVIQQNEYQKYCAETLKILKERGLPHKNFDVHLPVIYNKDKFFDVAAKYDCTGRYSYIVKSIYCNTLKIEGILQDDCKISYPYATQKIQQLNEKRSVFSIADGSLNNSMKAYIMNLYPTKSKYEY